MIIEVTYTKVVTEKFDIPSENGSLCDLEEYVSAIEEKYPEVLENAYWEPAGRIDEIKFPNGRVFRDLDLRFGGEW